MFDDLCSKKRWKLGKSESIPASNELKALLGALDTKKTEIFFHGFRAVELNSQCQPTLDLYRSPCAVEKKRHCLKFFKTKAKKRFEKKQSSARMALDFAAGCLGGCAGLMVGYPLDTIKVHIQTQDHRNPKFKGTWHCFRTILARESVSGFYRGMTSPMAGVAVVNAIIFGVYGQAQRHLHDPDHLLSHFLAGAMAGLAQAPVCSPLELAKTRLQLQSVEGGRYKGPVDCLRQIYRVEGHRGVFNGLGITALREAPSFGVYFLTYEALTRSSPPAEISTIHMLMAGGFAGTASWMATYPVDVIKSRLQADGAGRYSGAIDCLRQSMQVEGYKWLFRGLNSTIIRAFPTNAATFTVVTWTFRIFADQKVECPQISERQTSKTPEEPERERIPRASQQTTRQPRESFVDKCNSLVTNVMNEYNYESRTYCSVGLALIAGNDAARSVAKSDCDLKQRRVDADEQDSGDDKAEETLPTEEMGEIEQERCGADEGG